MHRRRTQENLCYFDKELPSEDKDSNKKMENNKVDKENKKNISDSKPLKVLVSNKTTQTSPK